MAHVLVVEDDEDVAVPLAHLVAAGGYDAALVSRGDDALAHVGGHDTDVVILDGVLPDMDGLEVCSALREIGFEGGLIMVTGRGGELDVVAGLDAGADDYLTKPCSVAELMSRVRSVHRRVHRTYGPPTAIRTPNGLHVGEHVVTFDGAEIVSRGDPDGAGVGKRLERVRDGAAQRHRPDQGSAGLRRGAGPGRERARHRLPAVRGLTLATPRVPRRLSPLLSR